MKIINYKKKPVDITELIIKYNEKYKNIFVWQHEDQTYIYRALTREEYKTLFRQDAKVTLEKEELLIYTCLLYPENINLDKTPAGFPTALAEQIIKNSLLSGLAQIAVLNSYREDMKNIDNQLMCVIHEAFPLLDLEKMEKWDVDTTMKYLSMSEWILKNLRGITVFEDSEFYKSFLNQTKLEMPNTPFSYCLQQLKKKKEEIEKDDVAKPERDIKKEPKPMTHRGQKKSKLTPEKLKELKEKYPNIDWEHDDGARGIDGLVNQPDTTPPLLRNLNVMQQRQNASNSLMDTLRENEENKNN